MVRRSVSTLRTATRGCFTGRRTKPTSRRPAIRASIWLSVDMSAISISTPGELSRNLSRARGTRLCTVDMPTPSRSFPQFAAGGAAHRLESNLDVADDSAGLFVEHAPAGVSATPRRLRTSSGPPIFSSRLRMRLLNAGWEIWRRAAARPKCSCSASTAKEANSWVSSAIN